MTEAAGARLHIVRILILQAVVWQALGKRDKALTALSRALELAEPADMVRAFVDERERQVLRLLGRHLSGTEIADELVISANTVRSHIKSIYGKLNVHQRTAVLERAKELDLL